ncbi:hypothetical protein ACIPJS_02640 [Streptomyces sp. NPDC086783]|uniref:hypothetical protein n=1 Tax=Streptomyces sp. NPDC086783 TaxID=3365758 RepID=UPI00380A2743
MFRAQDDSGRVMVVVLRYGLRDEARAIAGAIVLTTAALREVSAQQQPADASAGH